MAIRGHLGGTLVRHRPGRSWSGPPFDRPLSSCVSAQCSDDGKAWRAAVERSPQALAAAVAVSDDLVVLRSAEMLSTLDGVTTRERLHRLVDDLSDDQAAAALALLESQLADEPQSDALPEFFGMLRSGKGDLAARSEEILRAEFGRR